MSKTLTSLNPDHPHTRFVSFKQKLKESYRKHTTEELDVLVNAEFTKMTEAEKVDLLHPQFRHTKLEFLIARGVIEFKKRWEEEYGWPFDDCYDHSKFHEHMARIKVITEQQAKESEQIQLFLRAEEKLAELSDKELTPEVDAEIKEWQRILQASPYERKDDKLVQKATVECPPFDTQTIQDSDGSKFTRPEFDDLPSDRQDKIRAFMRFAIGRLIGSGYAGVVPGGHIVDRRLVPDAIPCQRSSILATPEPLPVETRKPCEYCGETRAEACSWPENVDVPPCREKEDIEAQKGPPK